MQERIVALFGGTFDPIHIGHVNVASAAGEHIGAEKIVFVPAKHSPLKAFSPEADDEDRFEMIRLAIADNSRFDISDYELKKQGPNYTLDTVRYFRNRLSDNIQIYWLIGADSLEDLPHWHGVTDLIDECNLTVMYRGGFKPPDFWKFEPIWGKQRVKKLLQNVIKTPLIDISSTEIRRRLATGKDISDMVCPEVLQYIHKHGLYGFGTEK